MRKITLLVSMLLLASLLLAACGAEETETVVPGTDFPTDIPTDEATATEPPLGTETVEPGDGTGTPGIPVTGEDDPSRLSNQLNFDVWNQNGEQIGEVNDMILDLDNTRVAYVIVGTGGFLEIGEKDVLVPWNQLTVQTAAENAAVGENAFILQADQELFENAPDVDVNAILPERGQPAGDWDLDIRNFWESGVVPATAAPDATASPEATAAPEMTPTTEGTGEATAVPGAAELQGVVLASEVLGSAVTLSPGQGQAEGVGTGQEQATATPGTGTDLATATVDPLAPTAGPGVGNFNGTIEDMIVDTDTGDIRFIVVSAVFDDGERLMPVPLSFFQWDAANNAFAINTTPAMVQEAPFFADGVWPDMTDDTWDDEFEAFWQ
ncbi:MAG TPA: PRC-barrel domain-containing protein [Anaerolineales bacterium]|nr:PRC-barrel domain-containing protein [Anaerolineales bacterium]